MSDSWWPMILAGAIGALAGMYLFRARPRPRPLDFADQREERLTRQVAHAVGCPIAQALPAVRHEIGLSPNQSDETLVKRATYHYRQNLPVNSCQGYRERARG